MRYFDLCLAWYWEYDCDFVAHLQQACQARGLSLLEVTPGNLLQTVSALFTGQASFGVLLDRADDDLRFKPVRNWAARSGAYHINPSEIAFPAEQKDKIHYQLIHNGIHTPYSIILPPFIIEPLIPMPDLSPLGMPFVLKPAYGGGGSGVRLNVTSWDEVLQARLEFPDQTYLLQERITPRRLGERDAYFRVFYVNGRALPCWWEPQTHYFTPLTPGDEQAFGLDALRHITARIAEIARLDWFSTEIALTTAGPWVVVDYINDSIDLRVQSRAFDGVPDAIVADIASGLADLVATRKHMTHKTIAPHGSWKSPITTDLMTARTIALGQVAIDGDTIYWQESRPLEGGRSALMRQRPGQPSEECLPAEFYVRTRVHEYGGGAYAVHDDAIYFVNYRDQHLYCARPGSAPEVLTPGDGYRYADFCLDQTRRRLICVREDHTTGGEAVNTIVAVPLDGGDNGTVLVEGHDFFSNPRLSPDGSRLAWLCWDHPNMPWDGTWLWQAPFRPDGMLAHGELVAGGLAESIYQPEWSPSGVLHYISDRTGWWNLYRLGHGHEALCPKEAEFGAPQWAFGMNTYGFISDDELLCSFTPHDGMWRLARLDCRARQLHALDLPYSDYAYITIGQGFAALAAASASEPASIIRLDLASGHVDVLRRSFEASIDPAYFSRPQAIEFPTSHGLTAHGIFYPPASKDFAAPQGEKPPLVVMSHGGPTGASGTGLRYAVQYWTSRGFAVLDVNYGGSTGYGREYRQRLNGQWGVVDVEDCCRGALWLAEQGLVDRGRMAIRGGSAGGFTTLACLVFRPGVFAAGASHFGVSDLEALARDTHKFESRYLDNLVGPYPERKDIYAARSPIHHAQQLSTPIILFQGDEDPIVPPNQSERMFQAARAREVPTAYLLFAGESHGFRKAENIKRALEGELYFYSKIMAFELPEAIEPVEIENL